MSPPASRSRNRGCLQPRKHSSRDCCFRPRCAQPVPPLGGMPRFQCPSMRSRARSSNIRGVNATTLTPIAASQHHPRGNQPSARFFVSPPSECRLRYRRKQVRRKSEASNGSITIISLEHEERQESGNHALIEIINHVSAGDKRNPFAIYTSDEDSKNSLFVRISCRRTRTRL